VPEEARTLKRFERERLAGPDAGEGGIMLQTGLILSGKLPGLSVSVGNVADIYRMNAQKMAHEGGIYGRQSCFFVC